MRRESKSCLWTSGGKEFQPEDTVKMYKREQNMLGIQGTQRRQTIGAAIN